MTQERIHDSSICTEIEPKKSSGSKKKVKFPSGDNVVSDVFIAETQTYDECSSVELISFYVAGCLKNNASPCDFLLEQLRGIDTSICNERYNKISLKGIRLTSSHLEALEEIFKRVQFREVDFQECYLDETCSGILFDTLKHYESCENLIVTSYFDQPNQWSSWHKCIQYLRKSKSLNSFTLVKTNLTREFFSGINFIGFHLDKLALIECGLGNDMKALAFFSKSLKNIFMFGSFGANKVVIENVKAMNKRPNGKFSSQNILAQKFTEKYSSKLWQFSFNLKGNKLTSAVIDHLSVLLTHHLLLIDVDEGLDKEIGDRIFQIFRGSGYLYELNLSNNHLKDHGVQLLVRELSLNLNKNVNRILINLARLYNLEKFNSNEEVLEATSKMTRVELLKMGRVKKVYSLEKLILANNHITNLSIDCLGEWLSERMMIVDDIPHSVHSFISLKVLDLSHNQLIGDKGVETLCIYLTTNHTLTSLILRDCSFSFPGVYSIASFLSETKTLELLDIRENKIQLNSLMALAKTLQFNKSLRILLMDSLKNMSKDLNSELDKNEMELMETFYKEINKYTQRNNSLYQSQELDENYAASIPEETDTIIENHYARDEVL